MIQTSVYSSGNLVLPPEPEYPNVDKSMQPVTTLNGGEARLELGVTRSFGRFDIDHSGLKSGWAEPEDAHNWNDGCEAVLNVLVAHPASSCTIEFTGEPYLNEQCLHQDVIFHVNGYHVGHWRLSQQQSCTLLVKIEPEQIFRRGDMALLRCSWSFPDGVTPASLGISGDFRSLGFCFRSITIKST